MYWTCVDDVTNSRLQFLCETIKKKTSKQAKRKTSTFKVKSNGIRKTSIYKIVQALECTNFLFWAKRDQENRSAYQI